jgi:hypothetical protein
MNQRFFAEFLALLAKRATEPPPAVGNSFEDKAAKTVRADGFDFEEDIMDETMAAEARDPFAYRPSVAMYASPDSFPNAPYRSASGQHLRPEGGFADRVKATKTTANLNRIISCRFESSSTAISSTSYVSINICLCTY